MNNVDYDKTKFEADSHGNLSAKTKTIGITYKGFKIDTDGIGRKRVWDSADYFVDDFPDVKTAKEYIDSILSK